MSMDDTYVIGKPNDRDPLNLRNIDSRDPLNLKCIELHSVQTEFLGPNIFATVQQFDTPALNLQKGLIS